MAKVSPVSIKYQIHASLVAEGALEKPDVIGAIFGQTEGLLGNELDMRELQKEGKIGRIEVDLERSDKKTIGLVKVPTALDQSETTLIAAAIETIERVGPCDAQFEIKKIEDVRGSKRDYIIERAKKLMQQIEGSADSREISNEIKVSTRTSTLQEYGDEKLPCGDVSGDEIIVVEGRADVLNLLRAGVYNVIAMNGTKLPRAIQELGKTKQITLFVDGDRGGKLIAQNVVENVNVKDIACAPDGKEVEELAGKEILLALRKRYSPEEFLSKRNISYEREEPVKAEKSSFELTDEQKTKLAQITSSNRGSEKALILDENLNVLKEISVKAVSSGLRRLDNQPAVVILDGTATSSIMESCEEAGCAVLVAKNFASTNTSMKLLSL